jgi:hypothetical protein
VDVALRGTGSQGPRILLWRDALRAEPGAAPDVRISPPASIEFAAFLGSHLVLGADFEVASQNRIWVYTPADLAAPNPTPSVQCLLSPPVGAVNVQMRGLALQGSDVYVYSVYDDGLSPRTVVWVTHVFRDVTTLANAAPADARVLHDTITTSALIVAHESLAVDADVLIVTALGNAYVNVAPQTLSGAEVPDDVLDLDADLGTGTSARVVLAEGEAHFCAVALDVFADAAGLSSGDTSRFRLLGPSGVEPVPEAVVRVDGRLFVRAAAPSLAIVGFDVGGAVPDFAPPDVLLGAPVFGDQLLASAGGALFSAATTGGSVAVYARAALLVDHDEPSGFLFDPDVLLVEDLDVAEVLP